jgi:competence protein ComEC
MANPAKPLEVKRALGNPGKRALPNADSTISLHAGKVEPHQPLDWAGMLLWNRVFGVGQTWISNNAEPILESKNALSLLEKSKIVVAQKGMNAKIGPVSLEVLWPDVNIKEFEEMPGEGSQINNSSIAMIISTNDWSIFTAGDLEPRAQHQLLGALRKVDIYKVCHHGSKYQDVELMSELSAQIAIISVGAKNSYGHPAPETIAALTRLGAQVVRTDQDGAIAITAKAHHLRVRKSKSEIGLFYWS